MKIYLLSCVVLKSKCLNELLFDRSPLWWCKLISILHCNQILIHFNQIFFDIRHKVRCKWTHSKYKWKCTRGKLRTNENISSLNNNAQHITRWGSPIKRISEIEYTIECKIFLGRKLVVHRFHYVAGTIWMNASVEWLENWYCNNDITTGTKRNDGPHKKFTVIFNIFSTFCTFLLVFRYNSFAAEFSLPTKSPINIKNCLWSIELTISLNLLTFSHNSIEIKKQHVIILAIQEVSWIPSKDHNCET